MKRKTTEFSVYILYFTCKNNGKGLMVLANDDMIYTSGKMCMQVKTPPMNV